MLTIMAQTGYSAENLEQFRNIGWLVIHYEVRVYEARLPNFTPTVTNFNLVLAGLFPTIYQIPVSYYNVTVSAEPLFWWYANNIHPQGYCQYIVLDDATSDIEYTWMGIDQTPFPLEKGTVFYGRIISHDANEDSVVFSTSVGSLFNEEYLVWNTIGTGNSRGQLAVTFYDTVSTL